MSEAIPFCWIRESKATEMRSGPAAVWSSMLWTEPAHAAGLVPLFAKPPESESPQWTKEPPSAPGHYWVWQPAEEWPCHGEVMLAEAFCESSNVSACIRDMDIWGRFDKSILVAEWANAQWLGPIAVPAPPTKDQV